MIVVKLFLLYCAFTIFINETQASSHWMVTENGLIQPKLDSPFNMVRPFDLLDFLNQEKRWDSIFDIYSDLSSRQAILDKLWSEVERNLNLGIKVAQAEHCTRAGDVNVLDWYAALLEDGSKKIPRHEFLLPVPYYGPNTDIPDCKKVSSLTFSMFTFEHLDSMLQRNNLTSKAEFVLPELISPIMTLDQFGHWLTSMLHRNSSSWLYYHMASLYWRINGIAPKAIECSRRALHYAPRQYKDIALGSLGMVLHRSGNTLDALIVLNAAIDHDPNNYVSHFAIANAYTVLKEFNTSIKYFERTLELNPRMELATKHKYGAICYEKLGLRINAIKETFKNLRQELQVYTKRESICLKLQAELLRTIIHPEEFEYKNLEKTFDRMSEITGLNLKDMKAKIDKNYRIKYFFDGLLHKDESLWDEGSGGLNTVYSLERLIRYINTNSKAQVEALIPDFSINIKEKVKPQEQEPNTAKPVPKEERTEYLVIEKKPPVPDEELTEFETGIFVYPSTITIHRNVEDFDKEVDWPSNKLCKETGHTFPKNVEAIFPVFLPFENKGIRMMSLLTDKLGVPLSEEYELPWHPPTCPPDKEPIGKSQKSMPQITTEVVDTGFLRQKLLEYVSDGDAAAAAHMQDAEIGHRIYVAMKKRLAPRWLLLSLSALYWRVCGRAAAALRCLRGAARLARGGRRDAVLVALGSVLLELGHADEALEAAEEAFRISFYEPATNFLIAELNMIKKHRNTHMFHLKQVVRVDPEFMGGLARRLLRAWGCILKKVDALLGRDLADGEICSEAEPDLVCKHDGSNCDPPNKQCSNKRSDSSTLVRLLDDSESRSPDDMDETFFHTLIHNTPSDRGQSLAHHANFDSLLTTIGTVLKGCGVNSCASLTPEDLALQEEDCNYQHLQMGYWLHIVSFRQLLSDSKLELPTEISSTLATSKKIPECRLPADLEDFYLEKIARADTQEWKPVLSLMHQFSEMFDHYDYITLGSKIAKYIETRPRWWAGLLAAGWWCGASGRGACAVRCLAAAHTHAPHTHTNYPLRSLAALLHMQSKQQDAKQIAYLSFYMSPKNKIDAFLAAVSHAYLAEYEQAIWMFRYALALDDSFVAAKASLHATMCLMFYGEGKVNLME